MCSVSVLYPIEFGRKNKTKIIISIWRWYLLEKTKNRKWARKVHLIT